MMKILKRHVVSLVLGGGALILGPQAFAHNNAITAIPLGTTQLYTANTNLAAGTARVFRSITLSNNDATHPVTVYFNKYKWDTLSKTWAPHQKTGNLYLASNGTFQLLMPSGMSLKNFNKTAVCSGNAQTPSCDYLEVIVAGTGGGTIDLTADYQEYVIKTSKEVRGLPD